MPLFLRRSIAVAGLLYAQLAIARTITIQYDRNGVLETQSFTVIQRLNAGGLGEIFEAETEIDSQRVVVALKHIKESIWATAFADNPYPIEPTFLNTHPRMRQYMIEYHRAGRIIADDGAGEAELGYAVPCELAEGDARLIRGLTLVADETGISPRLRRVYLLMKRMTSAALVLDRYQLIHRDIKPENILLAKRPDGRGGTVVDDVLGDFDGARYYYDDASPQIYTPAYAAPEVFRHDHLLSTNSDVGPGSDFFSICMTGINLLTDQNFVTPNNIGVIFNSASETAAMRDRAVAAINRLHPQDSVQKTELIALFRAGLTFDRGERIRALMALGLTFDPATEIDATSSSSARETPAREPFWKRVWYWFNLRRTPSLPVISLNGLEDYGKAYLESPACSHAATVVNRRR